jgi:hypothetical protein
MVVAVLAMGRDLEGIACFAQTDLLHVVADGLRNVVPMSLNFPVAANFPAAAAAAAAAVVIAVPTRLNALMMMMMMP